ncbi:DUF4875 domain-containing protein [Kiloniella laminariae]|uniref:DUF4875 domain-containing protein n=1 Tax=Kiloniella laminariae TaxID=454162 RepID=A0ABT4LMW1_9PROT|nr:DUF4875 domain-containing protein [Kiloniella laminariae]MCZ4281686.1 DUF4875 domain-containing protein [Kiloniella laminariae]
MFIKILGWLVAIWCWFVAVALLTNGIPVSAFVLFLLSIIPLPPVYARIKSRLLTKADDDKIPGKVMGPGLLSVLVFVLSFVVLILSIDTSGKSQQADLARSIEGKAASYQVLELSDSSIATMKRYRAYIVATSPVGSAEEYAATVIHAAKDLQQQTGSDQVSVFLELDEVSKGYGWVVARANYTPKGPSYSGTDKTAVWEVAAYPKEITAEERSLILDWFGARNQFLDADGVLNEEALKAFLGEKRGIAPEDFSLPYIHAEDFPYKND